MRICGIWAGNRVLYMVCARCLLFRVFLTPLRFSWGDVLLDAMAGHNPLDMDHTLCCDSKLFSVQFG